MARKLAIGFGALVFVGLVFYLLFGVYTIQPIGALPDGVTALVWRESGEPFFNSPDATCLREMSSVSIVCRMTAIGAGPHERILIRLPYMHWAYAASTGGREFDR